MGKTAPFQIALVTFFIVFGVLAVLVFSGAINLDGTPEATTAKGTVVMWGTYKQTLLSREIDAYNQKHPDYKLVYVQKEASAFDQSFAEAIASGVGPDLILLPQDGIIRNQTKLFMIPYTSIPERTFRDTYIQEGELYMLTEGIIGLPLAVDPIIMYYNRNMFEAAGYTQVPQTWETLTQAVPKLTQKTPNGTILQSALPFGVYSNLNHAKDIISLLLIQAGNPIVIKQGADFRTVLSQSFDLATSPAESVFTFFTQFSDPLKETYTWNRTFTNARDQFINERLAVYFGYASELPLIASKNPNLNFDLAKVPQINNAKFQVTFGQMQAVAIVKASKNLPTAIKVATELTSAEMSAKIVGALLADTPIAPARRDLLTQVPPNSYGPVLYGSAVISRGWYDPGDSVTNPIFSGIVDDIVRGASAVGTAIGSGQSKLDIFFRQN